MKFITSLAAALMAVAVSPQSSAQTYPDKPVRIIVAYDAGQGTDIVTRFMAEHLSKELGQPFIIENRAGGGGNIGTESAKQAAPDGYTLTMGTNATHVLNQYMYSNLSFDPVAHFDPIALVGSFPMVLAVNAKAPFNNVNDVLAQVKANPRGADIAMPSTTARLVVELLIDRTKASLYGVPYKGSGNAMADVLGGQLPVMVDTPTALRSQLAAGSVRAIGVTSKTPSSLVPGVTPVAEQGVADFEVAAWNALYAPKGTPQAVIDALNRAVNGILQKPEVRQKLLELGFEPRGGSARDLADFAKAERQKWEPIIRAANIRFN
ncbi:MAG: tripartite tricarboxylate transporter substrate binding protein [Burkholderiaceae bacterium]